MSRICRLRLPRMAHACAIALLCFTVSAVANQKRKLPTKPVDLNTATVQQLEQLPGIGPATAQAIVDFRQKSGPFQRVEDLLAVRRISETRFKKLRPYVTVAKPNTRNCH